jgi:hypothetical protein
VAHCTPVGAGSRGYEPCDLPVNQEEK